MTSRLSYPQIYLGNDIVFGLVYCLAATKWLKNDFFMSSVPIAKETIKYRDVMGT